MGKIRHHTVPCGYLKGFVENISKKDYRKSFIEIYDRKNGKFRLQTLDNTTVIKHIYSLEDEKGNKVDDLENWLGNEIDGKIVKIIDKISKKEFLFQNEIDDLILFTGIQKERTYSDIMGEKDVSEKLFKHMFITKYKHGGIEELKNTFDKIGISYTKNELKKQYEYLIEGNYDLILKDNNYLLEQMLYKAGIFCDIVTKLNFNITVLETPNNRFFITSDVPLVMTAPPENCLLGSVGLATKGLEITLPLSKKYCLLITNGNTKFPFSYATISGDIVRKINKRTTYNSYRFVLGHNQKLINNLIKQTKIEGIGEFNQKISGI